MDRADEPLDGFFHILHQKRIVEIAERRVQISASVIRINDIATDEDPGYDLTESQFSDQ
jgi:hypothetical protein